LSGYLSAAVSNVEPTELPTATRAGDHQCRGNHRRGRPGSHYSTDVGLPLTRTSVNLLQPGDIPPSRINQLPTKVAKP
jgi:hypothetical protein